MLLALLVLIVRISFENVKMTRWYKGKFICVHVVTKGIKTSRLNLNLN